MRLLASSVLLAPIVAATLVAQGPSAADPGARLHTLFDREWEWELQQSPLTASALSDKRWNDRWDDMSLAALDMRQEHRKKVLDEVTAIPRAQLSATDQVNYDVFRYQYRMSVEGYQYRYQSDPHRRLRWRPEHRAGHRHPQLHQRQGLRGLAGPARRVPRLRRSEHRADARGHAHERRCCRRSS